VLRDQFGIDDFIRAACDWRYHPSVKETTRWSTYGDQSRPLLITEFHTPAGVLHNEVFMSDDYHVERVNLGADQLMPRMVDRTIKARDDVEKFRYLLYDPVECDLAGWDQSLRRFVEFGRREGFPIGVSVPSPSSIAMKNIGPMEIVMRAVDGDPVVTELADILAEWTLQWIDYAARFEPDIIYHSAVYESTDFWSPTLFRKLWAPIHKRFSERVHAHGMKYITFMETGIDGLTEALSSLGIDALTGFDTTPPGDSDPVKLKRILGNEMALWGGLSPTMVVERGTPEQVREAVREHIRLLAPGGGYVLSTAGSVFFTEFAGLGAGKWNGKPEDSQSYRNLMVLFEAGREFGTYPIQL